MDIENPDILNPLNDIVTQPAKVISVLTGGEVDDDSTISVRYHGRCFNIHMSPSYFHNSPKVTATYSKYLQAIDPAGLGEFEDIEDVDVYDWIIGLFQSIFEQNAPDPLPSFDIEKIKAGEAKPLLSEYLSPETFGCRLEAVDEDLIPRHIDNHGGLITPRTFLDGDYLDELETWARFFEPSEVYVSFKKPEHALDRMPNRVTVKMSGSSQETLCFFKAYATGIQGGPLKRELDAYTIINRANFDSNVRLGRLVGIVHRMKDDATLGLLLQYIDHTKTLYDALFDDVEPGVREKWASLITRAVSELYGVGGIWGDAKVDNVLIDKDDEAWIIDFEGGYTWGWVDKDKAGTVEGDLQGLEKILKLIAKGHPTTPELVEMEEP